jgi:hypothetical protein
LGYVSVGMSTSRLLLGNEASSTVSVAASGVPVELDVVEEVVVVMVFRDVVEVVEVAELVDVVEKVVEIDDDVVEDLGLAT